MLLLSGQAAFADDEEAEDEPTESTKTTETCVVDTGGSPESSPEPTETEAAGDEETLAVFSAKPDNGKGNGNDKSADKSNNGQANKEDKSNNGQANKEDKANNGGGKEAAEAKKCAKEAERAARAELKAAIKESGGSWGAEMSRAAHIKVAIKLAAKAEMLPDAAKAHALSRIMALIGVNLDAEFDFASLFPEDFDLESALAYIDEIAALDAAKGGDDDDGDDVEPSPSPSPSPTT